MKPILICAVACCTASTAATANTVADLDWLIGRWCMTAADGMHTEEQWLPRAGTNALFGLSRSWRDGRVRSFEFLRIAEVDSVIHYLAQPGGRSPVAFAVQRVAANVVVFSNPQHDFPQQIEYRRDADRLQARISGPDGKGGEQHMDFAYTRCAAAAAATDEQASATSPDDAGN